jgi:hypothetical protein
MDSNRERFGRVLQLAEIVGWLRGGLACFLLVCALMTTSILILYVLGSLPAHAGEHEANKAMPAVSGFAIWTHPLPIAVAQQIPLGIAVPLGDEVGALITEFTYVDYGRSQFETESRWGPRGFWAAAGLQRAFSPGSRFFYAPKIVMSHKRWGYEPGDSASGYVTTRFGAGVDVGASFELGPIYIAPLLGMNVGYTNRPLPSTAMGYVGRFLYMPAPADPGMVGGLQVELNLSLLRLGAVF